MEAVQTWLAAAEIVPGPMFRSVAFGGRVLATTPCGSTGRIIKQYVHRRRGLDPAAYSGHSLR